MKLQIEKNYRKALVLIFLAAIVGGGLPVFTKIAIREISPLNFTFLRFFLASIFMLPFFLKEKPKLDKQLKKVIPISLLASINVIFFSFGIQYTGATISQVLYAAVPVIAAVFSFFLLKEKFSGNKILGIFIGFTGAVLIVLLPIIINGSGGKTGLLGNLIISVGVISFSLYAVASKSVQKNSSPIYLNSIFIFLSTIILIPFSVLEFYTNPNWWRLLSMETILALIYVGVLGTFLFYLLYQYAIKNSTPVIATMIQYIQPISAYIWAYFFLDERLTMGLVIGSLLVFAGAWLTTKSKG